MDYVKSGDQEPGTVIKRCEWVEGTEIGYWISDIGVGWDLTHSSLTTDTVDKKTAPMFVYFGKIGMVRKNDISRKSEKLNNILQHVGYLNYKFYVILIKTHFLINQTK